jgi:tRNA (mo5U34)-methyltransferase
MIEPMNPLPTSADDPRLDGWYHTLELAPGIVTRAVWDHRSTVDRVGLPASLVGKTALDVGTANGFWAFEMERRGAERVVATDIAGSGDVDVLPRRKASRTREPVEVQNWLIQFATAHKMLGSRVEHKICNVYDLSPETVGQFDVVYCGSLLLHLFNPLQALINIRKVTRELAVIETTSYHPDRIEETHPDRPFVWFGTLDDEGDQPGINVGYWSFTTRALCDMLIYAGFSWVEPLDPFPMKRAGMEATVPVVSVVAHVAPNPDLVGYRKTRTQPEVPQAPPRIDPPQSPPAPVRVWSSWRRIFSALTS